MKIQVLIIYGPHSVLIVYGDAVILMQGINLVQNVGDVLCRGSGGQKSPSGVQGRSPGRVFGGRSPPEAEAILDFYMHNFDLILNYFSPLQILGDVSPRPPRFTPLFS